MIIPRKNLFILGTTLAILVLLISFFNFASANEKEFPPTPGTENIDFGEEKTEENVRAAMSEKLKGTGEDIPDADFSGQDAPMGDFSDTPEDAEYAAGGRYRHHGGKPDTATEAREKERSACDIDPRSEECSRERKVMEEAEQQEEANINKTTADTGRYGDIAQRFELHLNDWACASTGNALFNVSGDRDIIHYVARILSHAFLDQGQHYGSNVVLEWHTAQDQMRQAGHVSPHNCETVALGDNKLFNSVMTALLQHKEMTFKWLEANEVESGPILSAYVPEMRSIIKKWTLGRLLHKFGQCVEGGKTDAEQVEAAKNCPVRNNDMILALLPILRDENAALDECQAGGQLLAIIDQNREGSVYREVSRMLDQCYEQGKLSDDPIEFGETLRKAGRDTQSRELFELAIQRGKLCNVWQRPEEHHRKDLTAAPVWTEESYPNLKYVSRELRQLLGKYEAADSFNWTEMAAVQPVMRSGFIQRSYVYGNHQYNDKWLNILSVEDIQKIEKAIKDIRAENDAYDWGCNGSIMVELWRISGTAPQSDRQNGATNLVLQYLAPIRGDKRLVFQLGEDTAQIDPNDKEDNLVFDDTYEHRFFFEGVEPLDLEKSAQQHTTNLAGADDELSSEKKNEIILLHFQLCHPEMHEKALDPPGKYCADAEWE